MRAQDPARRPRREGGGADGLWRSGSDPEFYG